MPPMIFPAPCPMCGGVRKFIEFKAEPCTPGTEGERRYGFRCLACKQIVDTEIIDDKGIRHAWNAGQHTAA